MGSKAQVFDETFRVNHAFNAQVFVATPHAVAMCFDLFRRGGVVIALRITRVSTGSGSDRVSTCSDSDRVSQSQAVHRPAHTARTQSPALHFAHSTDTSDSLFQPKASSLQANIDPDAFVS